MARQAPLVALGLTLAASSSAFTSPAAVLDRRKIGTPSSTQRPFFEGLDKAFEDEGPLGKGITVGKVQVALSVGGAERTAGDSIFATLERHARNEEAGSAYDDDYDEGPGDSELSKVSAPNE